MGFRIVLQEERDNLVPIKQVKFFLGVDKKTGQEKFFPLSMTIFRVVLANDDGEHRITWNAKSQVYIWKWPKKIQHPFLKNGNVIMRNNFGKAYFDTLAPLEEVDGEEQRCDTVEEFAALLTRMCGKSLASQVLSLFIGAIMGMAAKAA